MWVYPFRLTGGVYHLPQVVNLTGLPVISSPLSRSNIHNLMVYSVCQERLARL